MSPKKVPKDLDCPPVAVTMGQFEIRITMLEKFMDTMIDPETGVVPKLAVLTNKFAETAKSYNRMTTVISAVLIVILALLGYLLSLHLHA